LTNSFTEQRKLLLSESIPISEFNRKLVGITDRWLLELFDSQNVEPTGVSLVAVGGLGRSELAYGSDLDLVLVHQQNNTKTAQQLAEKLWYPIWDSAIELDHSVRTIAQTLDVANLDIRALFGMLDLRLIAGDQELASELKSKILDLWRKSFTKRIPEIIESDHARHLSFGDLAHLQSPNLKEAQGGLRDLVTLDALNKSWQVDVPTAKLATARQVLLCTRTALHLAAGKKNDLLSQELQPEVARLAGYSNSDELLRDIYQSARTINFCYQSATRTALDLAKSKGIFAKRNKSRTPVADGLVIAEAGIQLAISHADDDALLLRAAVAAAETGIQINPDTLVELASSKSPIDWQDRHRELLISLLAAGDSLLDVWEALDQAGVISNWIPHWDAVRFAPQRNSVHTYTVDRHLVQTVIEASKLTSNVSRPDILLLASLLHDIGKAREEDHSILGARLAVEITKSLGFNDQDVALFELMVRHHLLLPETATRRDLEDPETILNIQAIVKNQETLQLLHQLAIADAKATSAIAASKWRLGLINDLAVRVSKVLAGEQPPNEPELVDDFAGADDQIGLSVEFDADQLLVKVSAPDSPGLLSVLAGVFSLHRLIVRSAKTRTISNRAISQWRLQPLYGDAPTEDFLRAEVRRAVSGAIDVAELLAERERTSLYRSEPIAQPRVFFADASTSSTVVEVRAHDGPAILHRITTAISSVGIDIVAAHISTLGASADDVFYLRNKSGAHLSQEEQGQVARAILDAISIR
jgi:[protein-PII] uridylyltransferase